MPIFVLVDLLQTYVPHNQMQRCIFYEVRLTPTAAMPVFMEAFLGEYKCISHQNSKHLHHMKVTIWLTAGYILVGHGVGQSKFRLEYMYMYFIYNLE